MENITIGGSQGDILMRRKVQNAILLQRQREEAARAVPRSQVTTPPLTHTPTRTSDVATSSSYLLSSPPGGGASVDFSVPKQRRTSSPPSPQFFGDSRRDGAYYPSTINGNRPMHLDSLMDSPPEGVHHPAGTPTRRVFPIHTVRDDHRNVDGNQHGRGRYGAASPSPSQRRHTTSEVAAVREEFRREIESLNAALAERDKRIADQNCRIEEIEQELEQQHKSHANAVRSAVLELLGEASLRIRKEGFVGLERLRNEVASASSPLDSLRGVSNAPQDHHGNGGARGRSETEEERLHKALMHSVRQRYIARLQQ